MGVLYEATPDPVRRVDLLRMGIRRVALKMARLDALPDAREQRKRLVDRIDREFRTLLKLSRPDLLDVVQVYDFGFDEGVPYMALVEGFTLAEALEERPRLGEILAVFAKLCAAMVTLHDVRTRTGRTSPPYRRRLGAGHHPLRNPHRRQWRCANQADGNEPPVCATTRSR